MKNEIKDSSGKILFTAGPQDNKLNIHDGQGKKICCLEHDGSKIQIKDAQDKVITEMNTEKK